MNLKLVVISILMVFLTIASALATETITTGETLTAAATSTDTLGIKFYTHKSMILLNVTKLTGTNATQAKLLSANNVSLANATFAGNQAEFNYYLLPNRYYYLRYGDQGGNYRYNASAAASYPYTGTYVTIVNGSVGTTGDADTNVWNVQSFTIEPLNNEILYYNFSYYDYLFNQQTVIDLSDYERNGSLTGFNFNHGNVSGATWNSTGGPFGDGAYEFDGVDDYITINDFNGSKFTDYFGVGLWVNSYDLAASSRIFDISDDIKVLQTANKWWCQIKNTSLSNFFASYSNVGLTGWHYIYCGLDASKYPVLYIDGVLRNTGSQLQGTISDRGLGTAIGAQYNHAGNYFNGSIIKVQSWNQSLSEVRINQSMYNTSPIHQPVGAWIFPSPYNNDTYVPDVHHVTASVITPGGIDLEEAVQFDGLNDQISTTTIFHHANETTLSLWFKSPDGTTNRYFGAERYLQFKLESGGTISINAYNGGSQFITSPSSYDNNQWHHLVWTYSNTTALQSLYMDGLLVKNTTITGGLNTNGEVFKIGTDRSGANPFNGSIDEVKIYDRALTSYEVADEYYYGDIDYSGIYQSIDSPTNNTQHNTLNLSFQIEINSTGFTPSCYLYRNGTIKDSLLSLANGTHSLDDTDFLATTENDYYYYVLCNSSGNYTQSDEYHIYIDNVDPTFTSNLLSNLTQWVHNVSMTLNASDPSLSSIVVTSSCNFSYTNTSLNAPDFDRLYDYNSRYCTLGTQETNFTVCDAPNGTDLNCLTWQAVYDNMGLLQVYVWSNITHNLIQNFTAYYEGVLNGSTAGYHYNYTYLSSGTYNFTVYPEGHARGMADITINETYRNYTFYVFTWNSLNISFWDSTTDTLIDDRNISIQFIGLTATTRTTSNGTLYIDLLSPDSYTLLYDAEDYQQGKYIVTILNNSGNNLKLYMQKTNGSSLVLITVKDRFGNLLQGVEVTIQRWISDAWVTEQILSTDFNGQTEGVYVISTVFYNHVLEYGGVVEFGAINNDSDKKIIYTEDVANGITFRIDTLTNTYLYLDYLDSLEVTANLTFINTSNSSGYFRYFFNNPFNLDVNAQLVVRVVGNGSVICDNSTTTATGILICSVSVPVGQIAYVGQAFIDDFLQDELIVIVGEESPYAIDWGGTGYLIAVLLAMIAFFAFIEGSPTVAVYILGITVAILAGFAVIFKGIGYVAIILFLVVSYFVASINSKGGAN